MLTQMPSDGKTNKKTARASRSVGLNGYDHHMNISARSSKNHRKIKLSKKKLNSLSLKNEWFNFNQMNTSKSLV